MSQPRKSLAQIFAALRLAGRVGLLPFVPAGYPDLPATCALLPALESAGASAIEIGFPCSDPIADGPVIQEAFTYALTKRLRVAEIFRAIGSVRAGLSLPLVAMVSYSIVFRYGMQRFLDDAREAGFDAMLLPDLPPPQADEVCERVRQAGLDTVLLVAPTTSRDRRVEIIRLCSGFVYYLSLSGTTGERDELPRNLATNLTQLRMMTQTPICVGFGISKPHHIAALQNLADGAIVGSALVRRIKERLNDGPDAIARAGAQWCGELLSTA